MLMNLNPAEVDLAPEWQRTLEDEHRFEWIDGQLKEKPCMGAKANRVATILARLLDTFADAHNLGLVFTQECGYQIFPDEPRKVRKPDGSFIPRGRLPDDQPPDGHVKVPPDLVVEVVSPNDLAEEIDARVTDYLGAGVKLIWIIYPPTRSLWVVRRDGSAERLTEAQELSGEDVVPGFSCRVQALFAGLTRPRENSP
jgi:Uma2 family endonuclease